MAELTIGVRGASAAEQSLQRVAGGYRAIGNAAQHAARHTAKVHGGHGGGPLSHTDVGWARAIGGSEAGHLAHFGSMSAGLGAAAGAAFLGMELFDLYKERKHEEIEAILDSKKAILSFAESMRSVNEKVGDEAWNKFTSMGTQDKAAILAKGGSDADALRAAEAAQKKMKQLDKERFAAALTESSARMLDEKEHPGTAEAHREIARRREKLMDLGEEAKHETNVDRIIPAMKGILGMLLGDGFHSDTKENKYNERFMAENEIANKILRAAEVYDASLNRSSVRAAGP